MSQSDRSRSDRDWKEYDKVHDRIDRTWNKGRVKRELRRITNDTGHEKVGLAKTKSDLNRLEKTRERGSMRHLAGSDAKLAIKRENHEARTSPAAVIRRKEGGRLDPDVERRIRKKLKKRT